MKLSVICLFSVVLCLAAEFSSAQWKHQSRNGRHNTYINRSNAGYNYRGNQWNTNINHAYQNRQTNLNANYRRNHNFRAGYNWQNRQTNLGYTWNFGKRRRSIGTQDEMLDFLKIENEPREFLLKLQSAVKMFVEQYQGTVPELGVLLVSIPDNQVTNVTVAEEIVCVVMKLQRIMPKSLGNFIVKMIKFHGPSFDIEDLGDFFSVDPEDDIEYDDDNDNDIKDNDDDNADNEADDIVCEIPAVPTSSESIDSGKLLEVKKFVATLITVAMEYQQMLEE